MINLSRYNREVKKIVLRVIRTKRGGNDNKRIGGTGKLLRSTDTFVKVKNYNVEINLDAFEYYRYLDLGTKNMDGWFFTTEILENKDFKELIDDLVLSLQEEKILDAL